MVQLGFIRWMNEMEPNDILLQGHVIAIMKYLHYMQGEMQTLNHDLKYFIIWNLLSMSCNSAISV